MTTNLKTWEIVREVRNDLVTASSSWSWTAALIQAGSLMHFQRAPTLTDDLDAILIMPQRVPLAPESVTAERWQSVTTIRCLVIFSWAMSENVLQEKAVRAEDVAQTFIGSAGDAYDLGGAVTGYYVYRCFPTEIDYEPEEAFTLGLDEVGQVDAVAVTLEVVGATDRS